VKPWINELGVSHELEARARCDVLGPGGTSVSGWTLHRRKEARCLDPQDVSSLPEPIEVDFRHHGELMARGHLESAWLVVAPNG